MVHIAMREGKCGLQQYLQGAVFFAVQPPNAPILAVCVLQTLAACETNDNAARLLLSSSKGPGRWQFW